MSSVEIASTATEPVRLLWLADGVPVTGGAPTMRVRRKSDVFTTTLDFDAGLFTADADALQAWLTMDPVNATYAPGLYFRVFDATFPSNAVAPDIYAITFYADATLSTPLGTAEVRVGTVDTLDATATTATTVLARTDVATSTRAAPGAAMTLQADAITAATIAAGAIGASEAPLLANLDAAVSTRATAAALATAQGNITTILGYGAPPSAAAVSAQVAADLAGAHGAGSWATADISTLATAASLAAVATDATKARRALWNRRTLSSAGLFTLYADDAVTVLATATITDKDGAAITLQTGEAARSTALV